MHAAKTSEQVIQKVENYVQNVAIVNVSKQTPLHVY